MFIAAHNGAHVWGGAERATARLLLGLASRDHRVLLFCGDAEVARRAAAMGVPTELVKIGGDIALHHALGFGRRLRRDRPDALIAGTFKKLMLVSLAARWAGIPRVIARVGLETDTPRNAKYRWTLAHWVDAVVVNAASMRAPFLALPGWTAERVVTIYAGAVVPPARRGRDAMRQEWGIPPDAPVVGAIARLAGQKRLDRLLRAVTRLPDRVHCVLAGEGRERASLEALAEELGIARRVRLLGERSDIGDVLAGIDVFVITSDREGMSNAMLEALAAGVPVVSTPVSGAIEALEPLPDGRRPGLATSGFEPEEIAGAVAGLLQDSARLAAYGAAAWQRAQQRFSLDVMLDQWECVLAGGRLPTGAPK